MLGVVLLSVVMLGVVLLSVIMLSAVMLNVIMLSVVLLSVLILSAVMQCLNAIILFLSAGKMFLLPRQPWPDLQGSVRDHQRSSSRWDYTAGKRSGWAAKRGDSQTLPEQELPLVSARQLPEAALQQLEVAQQQLEVARQQLEVARQQLDVVRQQLEVVQQWLPVAAEGFQFVGLQQLLVELPAAVQKCPKVNKNLLL
jgi:hypothetical protein